MKLKKILSVVLVLAGTWLSGRAQYDGDPALMGYQYNLMYNTFDTGLFRFTTSGNDVQLLWKDSFAYQGNSESGREMTTGWIRDGRLCGYVAYYPMPSQTYYKYVERDLATGEVLKETDVNISEGWDNYFLNVAYCPANDRIYGYGFNETRTAFAFKSAPASNPDQAIIIKEVGSTYPGSICFNHETGALVGVLNKRGSESYDNYFVSIDVNTGQTRELFKINPGYISDYKCTGGLIWLPSRQAYVWNFYNAGDFDEPCSLLLEVNPAQNKSTVVRQFDEDINFMYFLAEDNDPKAVADAPKPVSGFQTAIDNRSVDISFNLPSALVNGSAISGDVSYTIYVDNVSKSTGSKAAGSAVSYNVSLDEGTHFIRVVPSVSGKNGIGEIYSVFVGSSVPLTPENIVLTENELTWEPVLQGIAGNPLTDVTYQVYVNNSKISETKDTHLAMQGVIDPAGNLASYQALIMAVADGKTSKAGYSNRIVVGKPWTVPFTVTPTETQFNLMMQEDVDQDNTVWSMDHDLNTGLDVLTSGFSRDGASDDWIFLPKFTAAGNKVYTFSFNVYLADADMPGGAVEVWLGDAPSKSAMKRVIIPSISLIRGNSSVNYSGEFVANGDLDGKVLYIGIGVTSERGILSPLRVHDINVRESATASINGPEAVGNLTVKRDENDAKVACLSFTMPSKTLSGTAIPASATVSVEMSVSEGSSETVTGKPGETVTASVTTGTGNRLIAVTPSYNGVTGLSQNCVSTLGMGLPGKVTNLRAAYDRANSAMRLDWDAPATDVNGKPMVDDEFSYTIWTKNPDTGDFEFAVNVEYPLHFATMNMFEIPMLYNLEVAVTATNSLGDSPEAALILCQVGKPFNLPIDDDFNGDYFNFEPMTTYVGAPYNNAAIYWGNPAGRDWGLSDAMKDADGDVLCGIPSEIGALSRIDLPKVSTVGYSKVALILNIWTGTNAAKTTIRGTYPGSDVLTWEGYTYYPQVEKAIGTVPNGGGYQIVTVNFPAEFDNQPWMSTIIEAQYPTLYSRFLLAGYSLSGTSGIDGVEETLYGTITGSEGSIKVTGYNGETVRVYALDGTQVKTAKVVDNVCDIPVSRGIYLVTVANRRAKVAVR